VEMEKSAVYGTYSFIKSQAYIVINCVEKARQTACGMCLITTYWER
jgi:hypothetical protein